ncbi:MAG: BrxA/BrxB family bacilliredoxin [Ignavibacteriales bacterium]|nr:BrxA/BrxB family bacilliredoxin [Ignavibacteriales bacterium]
MMYDILIQRMRDEVTQLGAKELRTPEEVDTTLPSSRGTTLVVVNSTCGCAAGAARPGLTLALQHEVRPDQIVTVFAGQDREATARAREYFDGMPPSSPSFALMKDGKFVQMIHRHQIEGHSPQQIAAQLRELFDQYCRESSTQAV